MKRLQLHHWILIAMGLGAALGLGLNWAGSQGMVDASMTPVNATDATDR